MNYVRRAKEKAKAYATRHVVAQMARMLANASDESLIRMTRLAERFMVTDTQRRYVRETRVILEQGHPALDTMRNFVSRDLHPNYDEKNMLYHYYFFLIPGNEYSITVLNNLRFSL